MVSVLDLMILCLDVDSVEDLPNFGSAEANPAIGRIRLMRLMAVPRQYGRKFPIKCSLFLL